MLEIGVATHSLLVGITLGTSFHQLFEGMAVSALVAEHFYNMRYLTLVMATPLGVGIGIGVRHIFNENNVVSLLIQGILESLAAGILLYDSIANIIIPFFASTLYLHGSEILQNGTVFVMWLGATLMTRIGYWA